MRLAPTRTVTQSAPSSVNGRTHNVVAQPKTSRTTVPRKQISTRVDLNHMPKDTPMWKAQDKVPRLPIPTLEETRDRYLEVIAPLSKPAEFDQTKKRINELIQGEGKNLQQELLKLDKESTTSWLAGFWNTMYLELRDPLIINVNPFLLMHEDTRRTNQVERAANMVYGILKFHLKIRNNALEPDFEKDSPMDMSQYPKLFGTSRIPQWRRDSLLHTNHRHIVVISNNHFFTVNVINENGDVIPEVEIQANLQQILKQSTTPGVPLGVLTTEERNAWAAIRGELIADDTNRRSIEDIDNALFVLTLDDLAPKNSQEISTALLHRDGTNRWYDKFNVVCFQNGVFGNVFEHSPVDGHTTLKLWQEVDQFFRKSDVVKASNNVTASARKLEWNLSSSVKKGIEKAQQNVDALIKTTQSKVVTFNTHGKKFITANGLSPDAYVQMAFQLAYYKQYGRTESTYESANTKRFLYGRTETIRSVTNESVAFTKTFTSQASAAEKLQSLKTALDSHVQRANLAKTGRGVDRHLFGLRNLAVQKQQRLLGYEVPEFFKDSTYGNMCSNTLSTSNVSSPALALFGFGPVISNGLGLAYNIHDHTLYFNVTSFMGEAEKYGKQLEATLQDMKTVVETANKK